ncbi:hypothetical protein PsYK624_003550 [Phanerochaete sordida]|uniref:Uncharacterized protein n=1 Tax=Phanerochaete sordida TaxID=48140 RepID=A0A9P3L798_9APHY|nr:hypothetical protein PsYK624_003550 [Phanerochaete sordida]
MDPETASQKSRRSSADGEAPQPGKDECTKHDVRPSRWCWSAYHVQALLCISAHILLILAHIALLILCLGNYEHSVTFALTESSLKWYPTIATTVVQVIGTAALTVLVALTQSLAFRRDLHVRQTLTALHDKGAAWLGFGAALLALWGQLKLRAAVGGVVYITAYLFGVWLLHITIPVVLDVVPYNATVPTVHRTTLANLTTQNATSASAYDILAVYDQMASFGPGLQENMIYDVIPQVASAVGNATVNASVYTVECAAYNPPESSINASTWAYVKPEALNMVFLGDDAPYIGLNTMSIPFLATFPYNASAIYTAQLTGCLPGECSNPILLLSPVSVLDSEGRLGSSWAPIPPVFVVNSGTPAMITALQLLACNVNISNFHIDVAADTRLPVNGVPGSQPSGLWKNWTLPSDMTMTDQLRFAQSQPFYSPPSGHGSAASVVIGSNVTVPSPAAPPVYFSPSEWDPGAMSINGDNSSAAQFANMILKDITLMVTLTPTAFDVFLNEDLGTTTHNRTNVTLAEINRSLAKTLAAVAWYGNNVNYSASHSIAGIEAMAGIYEAYTPPPLAGLAINSSAELDALYGEATIMVLVQRLRLNLSLAAITIGLVASIGLLVICALMIQPPEWPWDLSGAHTDVDSGGLLQYTWLLGHEPHLADVDPSELQSLRRAGMFEVNMIDRIRKRMDPRVSSFDIKGTDTVE